MRIALTLSLLTLLSACGSQAVVAPKLSARGWNTAAEQIRQRCNARDIQWAVLSVRGLKDVCEMAGAAEQEPWENDVARALKAGGWWNTSPVKARPWAGVLLYAGNGDKYPATPKGGILDWALLADKSGNVVSEFGFHDAQNNWIPRLSATFVNARSRRRGMTVATIIIRREDGCSRTSQAYPGIGSADFKLPTGARVPGIHYWEDPKTVRVRCPVAAGPALVAPDPE